MTHEMGQRDALYEKLIRRIRMFERSEEGKQYLGDGTILVAESDGAAGDPMPARILVREREPDGSRVRITAACSGTHALMLAYALCDQADDVLRGRAGYRRMSVRDRKTAFGCVVSCEYLLSDSKRAGKLSAHAREKDVARRSGRTFCAARSVRVSGGDAKWKHGKI